MARPPFRAPPPTRAAGRRGPAAGAARPRPARRHPRPRARARRDAQPDLARDDAWAPSRRYPGDVGHEGAGLRSRGGGRVAPGGREARRRRAARPRPRRRARATTARRAHPRARGPAWRRPPPFELLDEAREGQRAKRPRPRGAPARRRRHGRERREQRARRSPATAGPTGRPRASSPRALTISSATRPISAGRPTATAATMALGSSSSSRLIQPG